MAKAVLKVVNRSHFDASLFVWIFLYLFGGAVWLRMIPMGDTSGRALEKIKWRDYVEEPVDKEIHGFTLDVAAEECRYTTPADSPDYCGPNQPQMNVTAHVSSVSGLKQGLVLMVYSSGDFKYWGQGNGVTLPRDMFALDSANVDPATGSTSMTVSTSACFGTPGHYYVVGCLHEGVPPGAQNTAKRPFCEKPPCIGTTGPPFSDCLAIASQCVTTCGTQASEIVEVGQEPRCTVNGTVSEEAIVDAKGAGAIGPFYFFFMLAYTVGAIYFFLMYMPGIGISHGEVPSWDLLSAASRAGRMTVETHMAIDPGSTVVSTARSSTRGGEHRVSLCSDVELASTSAPPEPPPAAAAAAAAAADPGSSTVRARRLDPTNGGIRAPMEELSLPAASSANFELSISVRMADKPRHWSVLRKVNWGEVQDVQYVDSISLQREEENHQMDLIAQAEEGHRIRQMSLATDSAFDSSGRTPRPSGGVGEPSPFYTIDNVTTSMFSISAGEGANIILRNLLGKIASNLSLQREASGLRWNIVDGFVDEGHRMGAYYLMRAVSIAFYEALHPLLALKLATSWLNGMNTHENSNNVDKFDKPDKTDLFALLSEADLKRPQICYILYFHKMFKTLNAFTARVDEIFERVLTVPFVTTKDCAAALSLLGDMLKTEFGGDVGALLRVEKRVVGELMEKLGVGSYERACVVLNHCLRHLTSQQGVTAASSVVTISSIMTGAANPQLPPSPSSKLAAAVASAAKRRGTVAASPRRRGTAASVVLPSPRSNMKRARLSLAPKMNISRRASAGEYDGGDEEQPSFFSPAFVSQYGHLIDSGCKGKTESHGAFHVPLDSASYCQCILKLTSVDPLGCEAFHSLRHVAETDPTHDADDNHWTSLLHATNRRWLAYDHVDVVVRSTDSVQAIYISRGRPDLWQPESKSDHRRVLLPGVWACRQPEDSSDAEFWAARREIALVHGLHAGAESKKSDDTREVVAHFYADLMTSGDAGAEAVEGVRHKPASEMKVLNTHLGKAGGLNFGMEAMLRMGIVPSPSPTSPMFFGIVDARHSSDARFWLHVVPQFFELQDIENQVVFNPNIILCQIPHSYIGMKQGTDKLDVQNNFFFNGMAIFRDKSNGMTSAGTGGIWSVTSTEGVADFFFGRTMIEDTTSTHKYFLRGYYSKYIPPLLSGNQLMKAVPKVSANYLEALERWDTGAVQSFMSQGLVRGWWWVTLTALLMLGAAIIAPAFTADCDIGEVLRHPWEVKHRVPIVILLYSGWVFATLFCTILLLARLSPDTLNWTMRMLICFFNTTYPFTSVAGLFWMIIPPYVAIVGAFPFQLNAMYAILGSAILKVFEFQAVQKLQGASQLDEHSIAMTQKMDKVTLPIKVRAVLKGIATGYADLIGKEDNSWWTSFGTSGALSSVKMWLQLVMGLMTLTMVIAFIHLIIKATQGMAPLLETVMPLCTAIITAVTYIWLAYEPFLFIMKGSSSALAPRWVEAGVLVLMFVGLLLVTSALEATY